MNEAEQAQMELPAYAASELPAFYVPCNIILDSAEIAVVVQPYLEIRIAVTGKELRPREAESQSVGEIPSSVSYAQVSHLRKYTPRNSNGKA